MNNENFNIAPNDENEEFTVEFGEVINDGGTHDYDELDNKPQINGHTLEGNKTGEQLGLQDKINDLDTIRSGATKGATAVQPEDLARIATTGSYNDSLNKPSINNVALTGNKSLDALGIQPKGDYALESEIPDVSNFITNTVDNLVNYYKKSETFTKQEVNGLISAITTMDIRVVQTLPVQDISTTTIYLVPKTTAGTNDAYDEYIYVPNAWEHIGSTEVDLTNYVTNTDYATAEKGGTIRTSNASGLGISNGNLYAVTKAYNTYNSASSNMFIGKGTLENVITGKGLVSNTDYATSTVAGVLKVSNGVIVGNTGYISCSPRTYADYAGLGNSYFISKGTLENVITGKELDLKQLSTFDATKTQVLKNINGTLIWVDG